MVSYVRAAETYPALRVTAAIIAHRARLDDFSRRKRDASTCATQAASVSMIDAECGFVMSATVPDMRALRRAVAAAAVAAAAVGCATKNQYAEFCSIARDQRGGLNPSASLARRGSAVSALARSDRVPSRSDLHAVAAAIKLLRANSTASRADPMDDLTTLRVGSEASARLAVVLQRHCKLETQPLL